MKGISPLVGAVLVIAISVAAISVALSIGNPSIQKSKEILLLNQGKENLKTIDNSVNQVMQEGSGSSRRIALTVAGGTYKIYDNRIEFTMPTEQQIVGIGVSGTEDGVAFEATDGEIIAYIEYAFDFSGEVELGKGAHDLIISNRGGSIEVV